MLAEDDLEDGGLRMLEVDNRVILPELTHVRFVVTSADVIHSFASPSLAIKVDAYPGRLNQVSVLINREGVFYGQCSEICGILHSSMPIVIESVSIEKFLAWLNDQSLFLTPLTLACSSLSKKGLSKIYKPLYLLDLYINSFYCGFSTQASNENKLFPDEDFNYWIVGYVDAEGCFRVSVLQNFKFKTGYRVQGFFQISAHSRDIALLKKIQAYFGVGFISKLGKNSIEYKVCSNKDLEVIIKFFEKYNLIGKKQADFKLFAQAVRLIISKEHLTIEGLKKILSLKASMNLGLPELLRLQFPDVNPAQRPTVSTPEIKDPNWLVGFVDGEGCFSVSVTIDLAYKLGKKVYWSFTIRQHSRDAVLIQSFVIFFGCGNFFSSKQEDACTFAVKNFEDLSEKLIPFFAKYPLRSVKVKDFEDFSKIVKLIKSKAHLTEQGLEEINKIRLGMNSLRIHD